MGLFDFIGPASGLLFTLENIIWISTSASSSAAYLPPFLA